MDSPPTDFAFYAKIGREIADGLVGGRSGFGAFRHRDSVFWHTIELISESVFFTPSLLDPNRHWIDSEIWPFHPRLIPGSRSRFFKDVLSTPTAFDPNCIWSLFWALSKAEHDFVQRYLPFWSHEERLTGHLLSQVIERASQFAAHWQSLNVDPKSQLEIWYADTATNRRESVTGSDLGVVVHARYGTQNEFFKVVRLQAKKVNASGSAAVDLDQVETLLMQENLGYLLFYHAPDSEQWQLAPTVSSASTYKEHVDRKRMDSRSFGEELGTESIAVRDHGFDFASFITFALADPGSPHGRTAKSSRDAVNTIMGRNGPSGPPDRLLVITLGSDVPVVDWPHEFGEYLGGYPDEQHPK